MLRYALTIFLSAFLLFQVQPLVGKMILPWFGGSPGVWTTCMLFFQVVLLAGYAYAHYVSSRLAPRSQTIVHLALLALSLCFLPIARDAALWKPTGSAVPVERILGLLGATIGLPYFLLASTGPLLQESFRRETGRAPYRLYSLSNIGSLLALLSYPLVIEPQLSLWVQTVAWSAGYGVFVLLCGVCAWQFSRLPAAAVLLAEESARARKREAPPRAKDIAWWLALSACGSAMLLATTNQMTQEIPSVPFLWIAPLALYLLSFILCFDREAWYHRGVYYALLAVAVGLSCYALSYGQHTPAWQQMTIYPFTLFATTMVCHGELVRSRPEGRHATLFYLVVSAGGALGGVLVAIVAPLVMTELWEYQIGLAATVVLAYVAYVSSNVPDTERRRGWIAGGVGLVALGLAIGIILEQVNEARSAKVTLTTRRNFYGVLRVRDEKTPEYNLTRRVLHHGRIEHGWQFLDPEQGRRPTTYYVPHSGVGLAIDRHPRRFSPDPAERSLKIGVVGLGAGTMAACAHLGDTVTFYEINPEVVRLADEYFTYRKNSPAKTEVILGDARVELERQLQRGEPQQFDVLAIDAFSSDSIPMHLLTLECVQLYFKHLKPDGILCLHVTNHCLELGYVVYALAQTLACPTSFFDVNFNSKLGAYDSVWADLTFNPKFFTDPEVAAAVQASTLHGDRAVLWTDDYASLWQVLRDWNSLMARARAPKSSP